jgi:hypothetical protein
MRLEVHKNLNNKKGVDTAPLILTYNFKKNEKFRRRKNN